MPGGEGLAVRHPPRRHPGLEPAYALGRRAVRERLGDHPTTRRLLQACRRRSRWPRAAPPRRRRAPATGRERLAWNAQTPARQSAWSSDRDGQRLPAACDMRARCAWTRSRYPEQVLHVVPDLVGDDVRLREITGGAEPAVQLAEEAEVQVHLRIGRAVERPDRGAGYAARRLHGLGEQHQLGRNVAPAGLRLQHLAPNVFGARPGPPSRSRPTRFRAALGTRPDSVSVTSPPPSNERTTLCGAPSRAATSATMIAPPPTAPRPRVTPRRSSTLSLRLPDCQRICQGI